MNPTKHELAVALKEMAERGGITLGDAIVLRFAAELLREDLADPSPEVEDEGWITWNAVAGRSDLPEGIGWNTPVDVVLRNGKEYINDGDTAIAYSWADIGPRSVAKFRVSRA